MTVRDTRERSGFATARREGRRATWLALVALAVALLVAGAMAFGFLTGRTSTSESRVKHAVVMGRAGTALVQATRRGQPSGDGSGWVLDAPRGLIVTATHVINAGDGFMVSVGGQTGPADILAAAPCEDLALLQLRDRPARATALKPASADPQQGATVIALGFPAGGALTATLGVVTVPQAAYMDPSAELPRLPAVLQTDAAINPGGSGGPLIDLDGQVVGIDVAVRSTADGRPVEGHAIAITIDHTLKVLEGLRRGISTGWLGLTFGYPSAGELADQDLPSGLTITGVIPGTTAAAAHLFDGADQLLAIDGRPVGATRAGYCDVMRQAHSGDDVAATVTRAGGNGRETVQLQVP